MKDRLIGFLVILVLFGLILFTQYHFGRVVMHETLSAEAERPDMFFESAKEFAEEHRFDRSSYHVKMAIKAIRKIEKDLDLESINLLESGIDRLEIVYNQLLKDSLVTDDMFAAFKYSLNALTVAELNSSEVFVSRNKPDLADLALKHAQFHLRHAMIYEDFLTDNDSLYLQVERHVFVEIDSLIENQSQEPSEIIEQINKIISEMDQLLNVDMEKKNKQ